MSIFSVHTARMQLSHLIERACAGEEIIIVRDDGAAVRLVAVHAPRPKRQFGALRGEVIVPDSFFDPLPDDQLEGGGQ